ncbi:hypothetical protein MA9V1_211 [Chryseobacterium phage MA9V-1]|nr:hypothetical protein MA9V1_211 [Chryseobacterium phage MA9V-1]
MNIFVLDEHPVKAAQMQCNKHVVKMIVETAQMLSTYARKHELPGSDMLYKATHKNHPCTLWLDESVNNVHWLALHGLALIKEYYRRYGKRHKTTDVMLNFYSVAYKELMHADFSKHTKFALAMPEEYITDDAINSYRAYYANAKKDLLIYTNREMPEWISYFTK